MKPRYQSKRYCSICGQDDGWYDVIGDGYGQRCPIHGYLLRNKTRLTKNKDPNRWLKAI